jgi:hypothetical protein
MILHDIGVRLSDLEVEKEDGRASTLKEEVVPAKQQGSGWCRHDPLCIDPPRIFLPFTLLGAMPRQRVLFDLYRTFGELNFNGGSEVEDATGAASRRCLHEVL